MTSRDTHKEHIREHKQELADAISIGIQKRPITIGFHTSACSIDLLELYLHVLGKISSGTIIKHEWFKTPEQGQKTVARAEQKLPVVFLHKERILELLYIIEGERNKLIYGKPRQSSIEAALKAFQELHRIVKEKLLELGEEIA